jgi:hypothetical protein
VKAPGPRLTVCMPTYNGAPYLAEAVGSVLGQGFSDFRLVVVDDCSTDDTERIVRSFDDPRVSFVRNVEQRGLVGNWNRCIELADSPFLCIFHQDDVMLPDNLAAKVRILVEEPSVGMVYSNVSQIDEAGRTLSGWWYFPPDPLAPVVNQGADFFMKLLLGVNIVCCPSVVVRTACYSALGGFDPRLPFTADWEMWLRIALFHDVACLPETLVKYRRHDRMETARFAGARDLEQAYSAKATILEKYPRQIPGVGVDALRDQVVSEYFRRAVEEALGQAQRGAPDRARSFFRFASSLLTTSPALVDAWTDCMLEIATAPGNPGSEPTPILGEIDSEEVARRVPMSKLVRAVAYKLAWKPGFHWLYRIREYRRKRAAPR